MKPVSGILIAVAVASLLVWPVTPPASGTAAAGEQTDELKVGVNLDIGFAVDGERITVKGTLSFGRGRASDTPASDSAVVPPVGPFERVRRGITAARALSRATECVVLHCWRGWRGSGEERISE